jgi:hypothetical protein
MMTDLDVWTTDGREVQASAKELHEVLSVLLDHLLHPATERPTQREHPD